MQSPGVVQIPYQKDPVAVLLSLRTRCASILRSQFPKVTVDESGSKCIALSGGSLRREIDVVIANWWDTVEYQNQGGHINRGLNVLNASVPDRFNNKPFLHNDRIARKDSRVNGNLRKCIRLLKSLKYNAEPELKISSYDIAAICYNIPDSEITTPGDKELVLVEACRTFLGKLILNEQLRSSIEVPNGMRKIFTEGGASYENLTALFKEVVELSDEIRAEMTKTLRKVADAQIKH